MMNTSNIWWKVWTTWKKKSCSKKKWYWDHLSYMCKWNWGIFLSYPDPE